MKRDIKSTGSDIRACGKLRGPKPPGSIGGALKALSIAVAVASAASLGTTQTATAAEFLVHVSPVPVNDAPTTSGSDLNHVKTVTNTDWTSATAGEYEDALAVVEAVYGPIGDTNTAQPGNVDWRVINVTIAAKQFKASADDARALAMILEAEAIVVSLQ